MHSTIHDIKNYRYDIVERMILTYVFCTIKTIIYTLLAPSIIFLFEMAMLCVCYKKKNIVMLPECC